ncbi:MAG: hypothetical protein EBV06_17140, partial [Planctomycetia bacterium]|nr:hypothetical protein [Planctomycetia bacterium]
GDDEITGGAGVDTFIDAGGNDTLIEERDWDMSLFGNYFVVGKILGDDGGEFYKTSFVDANGQTIDPFTVDFEGDPDPQMPGLRDTGDRYRTARPWSTTQTAIPLEVESIPQVNGKSIFEKARITGGDSNNLLVVGDQDNLVYTPGSSAGNTITTTGWTGQAILDNKVGRLNGSSLAEYYIVNQNGTSGGTVIINDTGLTEGFDELYVFGTAGNDQIYLDGAGGNSGRVVVGERFDPAVLYNVDVLSTVPNSAGVRDKAYITVSRKSPGTAVSLQSQSNGIAVVATADGTGSRFKLTGVVAVGSVWTLSVDNMNYSYTAKLRDQLLDVARGLQNAIRRVNPQRDGVLYSNIERMTIRTMDGDDSVLVDDTSVTTVIELGRGDDAIVVATVPQIPDEGNKNLEYPDGVPVADTQNMTNGNSFVLYIFGGAQDDKFEVNHNTASLYLAGGDHDDTFIINTFLTLKKNPNNPDEITNLTRLFGGKGSNRYEYLQNAPVFINGGYGVDTIVVNGTPIDDAFVITENYVAGAGRIVYFSFVERIEINGAGGKDEIYVLSTPANLEITVRGGSNDDIIYLGGEAPAQVFDPPAFQYQPPPYTVQDPPSLVESISVRPVETFNARYSWWDSVWGSDLQIRNWAFANVVLELTVWYLSQVAKNSTFRLVSHSSIANVIEQIVVTRVTKTRSRSWWRFWD